MKDRVAMANAMKMVLTDNSLSESLSREGIRLRETISVCEIAKKWNIAINDFVK